MKKHVAHPLLFVFCLLLAGCFQEQNAPVVHQKKPDQARKDIVYRVQDEKKREEQIKPQKAYDPQPTEALVEMEAVVDEDMDMYFDDVDEVFQEPNTEEYSPITENRFHEVAQSPLSTFSIDVDNASYSNIRRYLNNTQKPPKGAVRIEEMVNYFSYDYPNPDGEVPFSMIAEAGECPWNKAHQLVHIGLQGKKLDYENLGPTNLVFLVDVSGSMQASNKLPLLKASLKMLVKELGPRDRIALITYASGTRVVLPSTSVAEKRKILDALDGLTAGGSTAGFAAIQKAYDVAGQNFLEGGNNRVILATDGDFNVGLSSTSELVNLVQEKRKGGTYLTLCGFGMGNLKDGRMEAISKEGNGNYFYIDNLAEAEKVFIKEMRANLFTIAKDVKIQVEFNPAQVRSYRLIGYENRILNSEDFEDDQKDAGELGAGHTVTAIYEVELASNREKEGGQLRYQDTQLSHLGQKSGEWLLLKLRYKPIGSEKSILIEQPLQGLPQELEETSDNFRFSAAVAGFGMLLRDSEHKGSLTYDMVESLAKGALGKDESGYRNEFLRMVKNSSYLAFNE